MEIIALCCENRMKHANTFCGQNKEFSFVTTAGANWFSKDVQAYKTLGNVKEYLFY
jgi:hypothetical protein